MDSEPHIKAKRNNVRNGPNSWYVRKKESPVISHMTSKSSFLKPKSISNWYHSSPCEIKSYHLFNNFRFQWAWGRAFWRARDFPWGHDVTAHKYYVFYDFSKVIYLTIASACSLHMFGELGLKPYSMEKNSQRSGNFLQTTMLKKTE